MISPDIQLDKIIAYAKAHNLRVILVVSDIDRSGRTFRRRSVDKCIAMTQSGEAAGVVVWKWSRWGRNAEQSALYLGLMRKAGGTVHSATEDANQKTAVERFTRGVIMAADELLSDQISEGWSSAHEKRKESGLPHSGRPRIGYDYIEKRYKVNKAEAPHVRWAYEAYLGGTAFKAIARELNQRGLTTVFGGPWSSQGLANVMDNGFAAGWIRERSAEVKEGLRSRDGALPPGKTFRDYDVWYRGSHEPIVPEDMWQEYRKRRSVGVRRPPRAESAVHALSHMLVCSQCAHRLATHYGGRAKTHNWRCNSQSVLHHDRAVSISNAHAMGAVTRWLEKVSSPEVYEALVAKAGEAASRSLADVKALQDRLTGKQRELTRLAKLYLVADDDDLPRYQAIEREIKREVSALRQSIAEAETGVEVPPRRVFETAAEAWHTASPTDQRDVLALVVGMIIVRPPVKPWAQEPPEDRMTFVPAWRMESWSVWLSERRRRPLA